MISKTIVRLGVLSIFGRPGEGMQLRAALGRSPGQSGDPH